MTADDPSTTMHRLTERVHRHYSTILNAWKRPDPDVTLPGSGYDDHRPSSGPSDPTGRAVWASTTTRLSLLGRTATTTMKLGDLLDDIGYELPAGKAHVDHIVQTPMTERRQPSPQSMPELLTIHRAWWTLLHDTVAAYAGEPSRWDEARDIVDFVTERRDHRLEHQLARIAKTARSSLIRPEHPAAPQQRRCSDRHGYGCDRTLKPGTDRRTCWACVSKAKRERQNA